MKGQPSRGRRATYCGRTRTAKIRYKTLKDAKAARRGRRDVYPYIRIYKCPACKGYHLTHEPILDRKSSTVWQDPEEEEQA
jgi:hypothetical protein